MFILKKKNIIKLGFNLGLLKISRYNFLFKLILSAKIFSSILDLQYITYKILLLKKFLFLHQKKNKKLLLVDGTFNKLDRLFLCKYVKGLNHFYINEDLWFPSAFSYLQLENIGCVLFWNYESLILNLNPWSLNIPFFFFFQELQEDFEFFKLKKFEDSQFLFSAFNSKTNNFFWLCLFLQLMDFNKKQECI